MRTWNWKIRTVAVALVVTGGAATFGWGAHRAAGVAPTVRHTAQRRGAAAARPTPAYRPGQLVVKFKPSVRPPAAQLSQRRQSFAPYTGSSHLDTLHQRYGVTAMQPLFPLPQAAARRRTRPDASAAEWEAHVQGVRGRYATRARRADAGARMPDLSTIYTLTASADTDIRQLAAEYAADPSVEYAEPNYIAQVLFVPNDPFFSSSMAWWQPFRDLWGLERIDAAHAWDRSTGTGVVVADVDTGVSPVPDLCWKRRGGNLWLNKVELHGRRGVDDDGNGYVDDVFGWDFTTCAAIGSTGACLLPKSPGGLKKNLKDLVPHGTGVSGVIAAAGNNTQGIIGVAWGSQVMVLKALNNYGQGVASDLARAIVYAAENGADVVNMSWGFSAPVQPQIIADAVTAAHGLGVVLVAAAGNEGEVAYDRAGGSFPAVLRDVIAVSAFDHTDQRAFFSSYGPWVDLAAPGGGDTQPNSIWDPYNSILTLLPSGRAARLLRRYYPWDVVQQNYWRVAGTSVAAPHVAGVAALVLARHPEFSTDQVRQVLRNLADDVAAPGWDLESGYGRVNAARATSVDSIPVARLSAPVPLQQLRAPLDVQGTAVSPSRSLTQWQLSLQNLADGSVQKLATGSAPVQDGILSHLDQSTLTLGQPYQLQLEVEGSGTGTTPASDVATFTPLPPPPIAPLTFTEVYNTGDLLYVANQPLYDVAVADLDGDGRKEIIAVAGFCTDKVTCPVVHIIENTGDNAYTEVARVLLKAALPDYYGVVTQLAVGDVDGDGQPELVVGTGIGAAAIVKGTGDNTYVALPTGINCRQLTGCLDLGLTKVLIAETNGNGEPEIILIMGDAVFIFEHAGAPGENTYQLIFQTDLGFWLGDATVGDSDNDGQAEIILAGSGPSCIVRLEYNAALGTYEHKTECHSEMDASPLHPLVADLDGDGRNELIYASNTGCILCTFLNRFLVFTSPADDTYALSFKSTQFIGRDDPFAAVGALPGLAVPALVAVGSNFDTLDGSLHVLGFTGFPGDYADLLQAPIALPPRSQHPVLTDMDGDGKPDLVVGSLIDRKVHVLEMQ